MKKILMLAVAVAAVVNANAIPSLTDTWTTGLDNWRLGSNPGR